MSIILSNILAFTTYFIMLLWIQWKVESQEKLNTAPAAVEEEQEYHDAQQAHEQKEDVVHAATKGEVREVLDFLGKKTIGDFMDDDGDLKSLDEWLEVMEDASDLESLDGVHNPIPNLQSQIDDLVLDDDQDEEQEEVREVVNDHVQEGNVDDAKVEITGDANDIATLDNVESSERSVKEAFIPSHHIVKLFPQVELVEASKLLTTRGVSQPDTPVYDLDNDTRDAVRRVVNELAQLYSQFPSCDDSGMECPCCYDDLTIDEAVFCKNGGHVYCANCVRRHAEELVFGSGRLGIGGRETEATEIMCIADGCSSVYSHSCLQRVLPEKVLERYAELQGDVNIRKANLDNLCACPKCGYKAIMLPEEVVFRCPNLECLYHSCRHCRGPSHAPLKCSEVQEKKEEKSRLKMEEEMTAQLIRRCPNPRCRKEIVKDEGCNKLTCSCGKVMCNVCKAAIEGYDHFCKVKDCPHISCGKKCSLWASTDKADESAIKAIEQKGKREAQKIKSEFAPKSALKTAQMSLQAPNKTTPVSQKKTPAPKKTPEPKKAPAPKKTPVPKKKAPASNKKTPAPEAAPKKRKRRVGRALLSIFGI